MLFRCEVHIDAGIDELADMIPVLEISRAAINFVDDDTASGAKAQQPQHLIERGASFFGSAFLLFKPADNFQAVTLGIARNRIPLFNERNSFFSLSGVDTRA